jgi:hypothetical protein
MRPRWGTDLWWVVAATLSCYGLGLLGSSERAAGLGGVLQVQSTPGSGVQVSLWIPLSAPTRAANVTDTERLPGTAAPSLATARHA